MLTGNIQHAVRSFISNLELICAPVRRFPCVAIRSSVEILRSNDVLAPLVMVASVVTGAGLTALAIKPLSLPRSAAISTVVVSGIGLSMLSTGFAVYCIKKANSHEASPDPRSDSEMMLSEMAERTATNDDVIDV